MAQLTFREAIARGIAQEMRRDESVVFLGEDIGAAGGVFKGTVGLLDEFGGVRVRDTPISEQAIVGAAMGAAMTGLRPIAEIMFSDFFAVCWDIVANEIAKSRYMTNGQMTFPLVIRSGNGGGLRFGAQHSQSVENWAMMIPGLKVVVPSNALDVIGLMAASIRDDDPVVFLEAKVLYSSKMDVPDGEIVDTLGSAKVLRTGSDATLVALGAMVPKALDAAQELAAVALTARSWTFAPWCRSTPTILREVGATGRLFTVEENPRLCGWGGELASIVSEEIFYDLDGPIVRITTPHIPAAGGRRARGHGDSFGRAHRDDGDQVHERLVVECACRSTSPATTPKLRVKPSTRSRATRANWVVNLEQSSKRLCSRSESVRRCSLPPLKWSSRKTD
jgi:pyruvate/2-oxoglutarate/acetoin dehydrogenase E1 component